MRIVDAGLMPYRTALRMQMEAVAEAAAGGPESLFLLEHPPVITFGRNGGEEHLPSAMRSLFEEQGVEIIHTRRGGSITCHFPGQLVAYPVMRIDKRPGGLRSFFHDMEESVLRALASFGIRAERRSSMAGVWIGTEKICSIGIAVKRWITCHGLSLNVGQDLSLFEGICPCGLAGVQATSVQRQPGCETVALPSVKQAFLQAFSEVFALAFDAPPTQKRALQPSNCMYK